MPERADDQPEVHLTHLRLSRAGETPWRERADAVLTATLHMWQGPWGPVRYAMIRLSVTNPSLALREYLSPWAFGGQNRSPLTIEGWAEIADGTWFRAYAPMTGRGGGACCTEYARYEWERRFDDPASTEPAFAWVPDPDPPAFGEFVDDREMRAAMEAYDHTELPLRVAVRRGHTPVRTNPAGLTVWRGECGSCGMDLVAYRGSFGGDAIYNDCLKGICLCRRWRLYDGTLRRTGPVVPECPMHGVRANA